MADPLAPTSPVPGGGSALADSAAGRRLQRLSRLMDSSIRLPGGFRIGWDGLIGLIPGIGDVVGLGVSAWIVLGAARLGASKATLARMGVNVAFEAVVGAVPIVGDLFDFVFKANERNMRLLERHADDPSGVARHSRGWLAGLAMVVLGFVLIVGWLVVAVLMAVVRLIF